MINRKFRLVRDACAGALFVGMVALIASAGRGHRGEDADGSTQSRAEQPAARHLILSVEEGDSSLGIYDSKSAREVGRIGLGYVRETQRHKSRTLTLWYTGKVPNEDFAVGDVIRGARSNAMGQVRGIVDQGEGSGRIVVAGYEGDFRDGEDLLVGPRKIATAERTTQSQSRRSYVGFSPHEIGLSPDGKLAYVSHFGLKDYDELIGAAGSSISVIDIINICEINRLFTFGFMRGQETREEQYYRYRAPHGVKVSPDGRRLYVNVEANLTEGVVKKHHMLVYDLTNGSNTPTDVWDVPEDTHNFLFSLDGQFLWLVSGPNGITRYEVAAGKPDPPLAPDKAHFTPPHGSIRGLVYSRDGRSLIASGSGEIYLLDPSTISATATIVVPRVRQFLYSAATPDGRYLLSPAVWEGKLVLIDLKSKKYLTEVITGSDPVHVEIAPGDRSAYVTHGRDNFITEVDLTNAPELEIRRRIETRDGPNGLALMDIAKGGQALAGDPASLRPKRKKLRFGACLPLSGPNYVEGQDMRLGYQFWKDLVNEKGGLSVGGIIYEVELVFRDTKSLSKDEGAEVYIEELTREMIREAQKERVPLFLLGTYPAPPNMFSGGVADAFGIPFVTAGGAAEVIYNRGYENVFGVMSPARGFLNGTLDMMLSKESAALPAGAQRPRSIAFISSDDFGAYQDAITTSKYAVDKYNLDVKAIKKDDIKKLTSFRIEMAPGGGTGEGRPGTPIIVYKHPENEDQAKRIEEEFPALLALIRAKKFADGGGQAADIVSLTGHLPQGISFVKAARGIWPAPRRDGEGYPQAIILSVGPANPAFSLTLGKSSLHVIGAAVWSPNQRQFGHDPFIEPGVFADKFFARFNKQPSYLTAGATTSGLVYEVALQRAGSIDSRAVREALRSISGSGAVELFYSRIDFDKRGLNNDRPLGTIQLESDEDGGISDVVLWPPSISERGRKAVWPFPGFTAPTKGEVPSVRRFEY